MDLNRDALAEIAFDAGTDGIELPASLRGRLLEDIGTGGRRPMHRGWDGAASPAAATFRAFVRTAGELAALLADLDPEEWERPTSTPAGSVRGLALHLVGVERYALGQLGRRPPLHAPTREDHFPITRSAADDAVGLADDQIARAWWLDVMEVLRACGELGPTERLDFHHLPLSVRGFLVVRTFELWTHGEDIRRANGRPLNPLDDERLALMSRGLVDVLALGMAVSGTTRPGHSARIVLTGPGGDTYDVALAPGEPIGAPDATVTMSTLDLCRVAARQLPIDDAEIDVRGDAAMVEPMLVGAQAFAAD